MAAQFFIIYINNREQDVTYEDLEEKMDHALDWYRIRENLWVVYSTSNAEQWYERLRPLIKKSGNLFICELKASNRQGWMPENFWKWFDKSRDT